MFVAKKETCSNSDTYTPDGIDCYIMTNDDNLMP